MSFCLFDYKLSRFLSACKRTSYECVHFTTLSTLYILFKECYANKDWEAVKVGVSRNVPEHSQARVFKCMLRKAQHLSMETKSRESFSGFNDSAQFNNIARPTCRQCPHPPSGRRNRWRWYAVCQTPGGSSWHPARPAYGVCWSCESTKHNRKGKEFERVNPYKHWSCSKHKSLVITRQNGRSVSQPKRRWPHSRSSWTRLQRRWRRWSQLDTRRWSPGGRRKTRHISLHKGNMETN